jgi:iron complex transport system substrate-binding protein
MIKSTIAFLLALALNGGTLQGRPAGLEGGDAAHAAAAQPSAAAPTRIVSLVPAVTESLFAIGAGPQVIAVSSFDHFPAEVEALPRVGALLDPDTERILSLKPDLVVVYGSQTDLQTQFARAGIRTYVYRHGGVAKTLDTISGLGQVTGHTAGAARVVANLRAKLDRIRRVVAGRARPRTLLVLTRQPGSLRVLYASGGVGFLHDLLEAAGAANVFSDIRRESAQPSQETLLTRRPDVVVELQAAATVADTNEARRVWSTLSSIPAVQANRIHVLTGAYLVTPGPRLGDAAEAIARAVHPDAF